MGGERLRIVQSRDRHDVWVFTTEGGRVTNAFLSKFRDPDTNDHFLSPDDLADFARMPPKAELKKEPVSLLDPQYEGEQSEPVTVFVDKHHNGATAKTNGRVEATAERGELISENDMAFFQALAVIFPPKKVTEEGKTHIVMTTWAGEKNRGVSPQRDVLRATIGTKGVMDETHKKLQIKLPYPEFVSLLSPRTSLQRNYFAAKNRYVPFLMALLLFANNDRLELNGNHSLPERVHNGFADHFLSSLGEPPGHGRRKNNNFSASKVNNPQKLLATLMGHPTVTSLSFYEGLKGLPQLAKAFIS